MIEVKVDTATPRSPSSSTNCEKGSTMIGQRTRPHPLDGPAKRACRAMRESVSLPPMATIECKSAQPNIPSVWVEVEGVTDDEVTTIRNVLDRLLESDVQVSTAVAQALVAASRICQRAPPRGGKKGE